MCFILLKKSNKRSKIKLTDLKLSNMPAIWLPYAYNILNLIATDKDCSIYSN